MNVLEKMNQCVGTTATKNDVTAWAYRNRILVLDICDEDPKFETLRKTVETFAASDQFSDDEHDNWSRFLDLTYIKPSD